MSENTKEYPEEPRAALGIDIGGTKVGLGLITESGRIIKKQRYPMVLNDLNGFINDLITRLEGFFGEDPDKLNLMGIGIGIKGLVDFNQQKLVSSSIFPRVLDVDICKRLGKQFHVPVVMDNDVKAAALAEARFGDGRVIGHFVYVNVGTGISIGIVDRGKVIRGKHNYSGEFGKTLFASLEEEVPRLFCLESVASGKGLEEEFRRLSSDGLAYGQLQRKWSRTERNFTDEIFTEYKQGDPFARKVVDNALHYFALSIINLESTLDAHQYIFGGGVINDGWFVEQLREKIQGYCGEMGLTWDAKFSISQLGVNDIGLIGAACVFFETKDNSEKD